MIKTLGIGKSKYMSIITVLLWLLAGFATAKDDWLGLPELVIPQDNPQTPEKIKLGEKLFKDTRFSSTGKVSCATCHDDKKGFSDNLRVSEGINELRGTRNAPTVINAAFLETQFWDGREPDLESQAKQPFLNPIEMGLTSHQPIIDVVSKDVQYQKAFKVVFNIDPQEITIDHVVKAIASFERTVVAGNSPFDRYYFGGDATAISQSAKRGFQVFLNEGRCVSCHTISQDHALFTDNRFHNIGVGFERIAKVINELSTAYLKSKEKGIDVDISVLTNKNTSELGRFALTGEFDEIGAFKTPTIRNIELTPPYMHDGSLATLEEVVEFYDHGGRIEDNGPVFDFLSGGIKPLNFTEQQEEDLVEFLKTLTSDRFARN